MDDHGNIVAMPPPKTEGNPGVSETTGASAVQEAEECPDAVLFGAADAETRGEPGGEPDSGGNDAEGGAPAEAEAEEEDAKPKPFPVESLPGIARRMAEAISETAGVPLSLSGPVVLGVLSGAIGKAAYLKSRPGRVTRGNVFILVSGESGCGKSETYRLAMAPLEEAEAEAMETYRRDTLPELEAEKEVLLANLENLKKGLRSKKGGVDGLVDRHEAKELVRDIKRELAELEAKSHAPRLTCADVTVEKLACLLGENGETIFSTSSDAGSLVDILLGRYNALKRTDDSIYLNAWTGDPVKNDRKNLLAPVLLRRPCMAGLWLCTPDELDSLLGERSLVAGGFLPRTLAVHSRAELLYDENRPGIPVEVESGWRDTVRRLLKLREKKPAETEQEHADGLEIPVSREAREELRAYFNAIIDRRRKGLSDVGPFAARWCEQAWRLALVIRCAATAGTGEPVSGQTARDAVELAKWFAEQQLGILAAGRTRKQEERVERLSDLLRRYDGQRTVSQLKRRHGFEEAEVRAIVAEFPSAFEIFDATPPGAAAPSKGGRPSFTVRIRPTPPR